MKFFDGERCQGLYKPTLMNQQSPDPKEIERRDP